MPGKGSQQQESQQQRPQRRRILGPAGPGAPHALEARGDPARSAEHTLPGPVPGLPRRWPSFARALGLRLLRSHRDGSYIQAAASFHTAPGSPALGAPLLTGHLRPWPGSRREAGGASRSLVLPRSGAGSAEPRLQARGDRRRMGFPRCGEGGTGGARVPSPEPDAATRARGCEARKPRALARATCHPPPPLRRGLCPHWFARSLGSGSSRECYCSSEQLLIDKEST